MTTSKKSILEVFLPEGILEWFDPIESRSDENNIYITLKEKNIPPVTEENKNKKIISKGLKDFTITDFPARGKRVLIKIQRRYWKVEDQKEYLKRDIKISFPGTQLEKEFALFLKEDGGRECGLADFYRKVSQDPGQRI